MNPNDPRNTARLQQHIDRKMAAQVERQAGQSIFTPGGALRDPNMRAAGHVQLGDYLDLSTVPWAPEPDGPEHCQNLARLVEYMGELPGHLGGVVGGPLSVEDRKILYCVAMLYCTGRAHGQHGYEQRSAATADTYLRSGAGANTAWSTVHVREEVCRLIAKHTDERAIVEDKRLQVFADAVRMEVCRHAPNTGEGLNLLREHWRPELWHSAWGRDKNNARAWMTSRGWR